MPNSLYSKYLNMNLLPFCFRLCPTASVNGMIGAETIGHKTDTRLNLTYFITMSYVFVSEILARRSKYVF